MRKPAWKLSCADPNNLILYHKFVRDRDVGILAVGDKKTRTIRPDFDGSISIDFQGAKTTGDTGVQPSRFRNIVQRTFF
jgi:hypothetical protein